MSYLRPSFIRTFSYKSFICFFCITYTFLDITGAIVSVFNRTRGGVVHDGITEVQPITNTNNTLNLVITVKPTK
jgi:hypothetical protein